MPQRFYGFFSGFPSYHFTDAVIERLAQELTRRARLVFISAWPQDFARNDADRDGMHELFAERGLPFERREVVDDRTDAPLAASLIKNASCVFLMGGHPGRQMRLIQEKGLAPAIREADGAVLGISAGAINMGVKSLDTKDSPVPYAGLGLADVTVKPHFEPENPKMLAELRQISEKLPICAMEDDSAIFIKGDNIAYAGRIHLIRHGDVRPISTGDR